jgi:alkylhydroperoxidase/carboxymuconolactone decarboxylase family protein YurZ
MDKVFGQMALATREHVWAIPELSDREKVLLSVVADVCQGSLGAPFDLHVRIGVARGVSTVDIRALLRFISYDCGYHAALAAFERLASIELALGVSAPDAEPLPAELVSTGPDAAPSPLPAAVRAQLADLDPHFAEHFDLQSRMRSQGTLSVREKAFATMSIDVHYQTLEESFQIHVDRALGAGASVEDVRAVLRFNGVFGMIRAWRAWKALNAHLATLTPAA